LKFSHVELPIWSPEDHEYFVIFGQKTLVDRVTAPENFPYRFAEYAQEKSFNTAKKRHLQAVQERYTIQGRF